MTIRIFIDQGHNPGTVNAGASANGLEEQAVNFEVGNMLADLLDQDCRFAVRTSRMYPAAGARRPVPPAAFRSA